MFGRSKNEVDEPERPPASDAARIQGGGLAQVIVTGLEPIDFHLYLNDRLVPAEDVESLSVAIESPDENGIGEEMVRATLARYVTNVEGKRTQEYTELFPCTLYLVANDRRVAVTCQNAGSLNGLWISLGLKSDGTSSEVSGAKSLRIVVSQDVVDARLTWLDGTSEDLLGVAEKAGST